MRKRQAAPHTERGSILVLTALILVVLLGFSALVLDMGLLYLTRRDLQNAADAAALAGASQLPDSTTNATSQAQSYLTQNGVLASDATNIQIVNLYNPNDGVRVTIRRNQPLLLGPVLGFMTQDVVGEATAIVSQITPTNIWPWGLPENELNKTGPIVLKQAAFGNTVGNFHPLQLGDQSGASAYEAMIVNGYNGPVPAIPPGVWQVWTETGNMSGPTVRGAETLLNQSSPYPFTDIRHPRVGIVPIISQSTWEAVHGKSRVDIIGFAVFLLLGIEGKGGHAEVVGQFMHYAHGVGGSRNIGHPLEGLIGVRLWQ